MRNLALLLVFLCPIFLLLGTSQPDLAMRTTEAWEWACIAFAVIASALFTWYYAPEIMRARDGNGGPDFSTVCVLFLIGCMFNYMTTIVATPLFMPTVATETVDVLEDSPQVTYSTSKSGKRTPRTCDHHVVFRFADGRIDSMCTDRTRGAPLSVPGKATLHLRQGWAGRGYAGISPVGS